MSIAKEHELRARLSGLARQEKRRISMEGYYTAGVLVPIVFGGHSPELLFTRRTELVETHKGQVSFPGGMVDPDDVDVVQTALREAWEEVGIPGSAVTVMGTLNDLATPTGFVITPVVGIIEQLPTLNPNADEVAEVFRVPLSLFADPRNGRSELREMKGKQYEVWYYQSEHHMIWGATAMIVRALLKQIELL